MYVIGKLLFRHKGCVILTVILSILSAAIALWWNVVLSEMITIVSIGQSPSQMQMISALSIILVLGAVCYCKTYFAGLSCEKMSHGLRMGYAWHISSLPIKVISELSVGDHISKLQNEMVGITSYLHTCLFLLIDDTVKFIMTFIGLLMINTKLTLQANAPAFILVGYIFWSSRIIGEAVGHSQHSKGRMNQYADVLLTLFPVIYLYNGSHMVMRSYEKEVNSWEQHTLSLERTKAWMISLSGLLSIIPTLLLIFIGGNMVIHGELTIGYLYIFLNLSGNVSGVLMNMPGHIAAFRQFLTNLKHMGSQVVLS